MSTLLGVILAQQSAAPPAPPADPRPVPLDDVVAFMRPAGRVIFTATVDAAGGGDYTTIQAAVDAAKAAQAAALKAGGLTTDTATPNYAARLIVKAGQYREALNVGGVPWLQLYGAGADKTVILPPQDGTAHRGVLEAGGRLYVEGLTLHLDARPSGQTNPVYPIHTNNRGTSIYADVRFRDDVGGVSGYSYGSDGQIGGFTYLYRCALTGGVNGHGWAGMVGDQAAAYVSTTAGGRLGWDTMEPQSPADVWIVGGTSASVVVKDAASRLHLDPAHTTGAVTSLGTRDTDTRWPVPAGGLSPWDAARYGMGDPDAVPPAGTPGH